MRTYVGDEAPWAVSSYPYASVNSGGCVYDASIRTLSLAFVSEATTVSYVLDVAALRARDVDRISPFVPCLDNVIPCTDATAGRLVLGTSAYTTVVATCGSPRLEASAPATRPNRPILPVQPHVDSVCSRNTSTSYACFSVCNSNNFVVSIPASKRLNWFTPLEYGQPQTTLFQCGCHAAFCSEIDCTTPLEQDTWSVTSGGDETTRRVTVPCVGQSCAV